MAGRVIDALIATVFCVACLVCVYVAAFSLNVTNVADHRVLEGFMGLRTPANGDRGTAISEYFNFGPYAVAAAIVVSVALVVGGVRTAAAASVLFVGANVTTQILKPLLAAPRQAGWLPDGSWPSGHMTAATTLALCVVLIAPPLLRPYAVGAGTLGVVAAAYSIVLIGSHYPSDVVGGMFVAGAWTALVIAGLEAAAQRWPAGRPAAEPVAGRWVLWSALLAVALAVVALVSLVASVMPVASRYLSDHATFVAGGVTFALCAALLTAATAVLAPGPPVRRKVA